MRGSELLLMESHSSCYGPQTLELRPFLRLGVERDKSTSRPRSIPAPPKRNDGATSAERTLVPTPH